MFRRMVKGRVLCEKWKTVVFGDVGTVTAFDTRHVDGYRCANGQRISTCIDDDLVCDGCDPHVATEREQRRYTALIQHALLCLA